MRLLHKWDSCHILWYILHNIECSIVPIKGHSWRSRWVTNGKGDIRKIYIHIDTRGTHDITFALINIFHLWHQIWWCIDIRLYQCVIEKMLSPWTEFKGRKMITVTNSPYVFPSLHLYYDYILYYSIEKLIQAIQDIWPACRLIWMPS